MNRKHLSYLETWKVRKNRKPLIVRGARQVGKTFLVRDFADRHFENLVELNMELNPEKAGLFDSKDIDEILRLLELDLNVRIVPGKTLLFIDEIQRTPELIGFLRYFFELKPELHVMAAGSLLEFVLSDHKFSMPVGRVEYLFLGPLDFYEFLEAMGQVRLVDFLRSYTLDDLIPESIHRTLMGLLKRYCIVGGMPSSVREYADQENYRLAHMEQKSILQTYQDDFAKYGERINFRRLQTVFTRLPGLIGEKLKYVNIDRNERAKDLLGSIEMLQQARVIYCVKHSSGNGVPLEAESDPRSFKPLFLDVGLLSASLGLGPVDISQADDLLPLFNGAIAEQFAGQQLLYRMEVYEEPMLHYWHREKKGSAAEIDYLIAHGTAIIPVEIKAGKTGTLKSLHGFVAEKGSEIAVRLNMDLPSECEILPAIPADHRVPYVLISLPLYLIKELDRIVDKSR